MELRELPSVDELLRSGRIAHLGHATAVAAAREVLARAREEITAGHDPGDLVERTLAAAGRQATPQLRRLTNATAVVLHTNVRRAPLPPAVGAPATATAGA